MKTSIIKFIFLLLATCPAYLPKAQHPGGDNTDLPDAFTYLVTANGYSSAPAEVVSVHKVVMAPTRPHGLQKPANNYKEKNHTSNNSAGETFDMALLADRPYESGYYLVY